ncbi:MAG TPA: hypothetical protein VGC64_09265 [Pyrinomonadaceae bacterium]|jgi:hypothetical protein
MIPEEMQRTMQFLLENQAAHDARLAKIEDAIDKLSASTATLVETQRETQAVMRIMQDDMRSIFGNMGTMQSEFRDGLEKILTVSEQTMAAVRQVAEAEARTIGRVGVGRPRRGSGRFRRMTAE